MRAIAQPPGAAPDRLGTSGQIWKGNPDREARVGRVVREQPCSRAVSQNPLLTANLQTRGENLAAGQTSCLWPPATILHCSHDFLVQVFLGQLGVK